MSIVVAELVGDGTLGLLLGLLAFGCIVYAMTRMPLRHSLMGLAAASMLLPRPGEGQPSPWAPPFSTTGQALMDHLNTLDRNGLLGSVPVSTMEIFFAVLFVIWLRRRRLKSEIDGEIPPTPQPLVQLAQLALAAAAFIWLEGLLNGGDFGMSLWQVNAVIYVPIVFLLMQAALRGPEDYWALAKVCLIPAAYKCVLATFVVTNIEWPSVNEWERRPAYGTSHADSMLFSLGFAIILAPLIEGVRGKWVRLSAFMLPLLVMGTHFNNRRLAWVQVAVVLLMLYSISGQTRLKRMLNRGVLILLPVASAYLMAGWDSKYGSLFKPVRTIRSVIDAESDSSSQWRELENVNLITTFRENPILGSGYGIPYRELIVLPEIDYALERYLPHNGLLGLWAYAGMVGFACLSLLWVAGMYFAIRAYHASVQPADRAAAIVAAGAVPIYLTQCWGDIGLTSWTGVFLMGTSLALAGKLAVNKSQWRDRGRVRRSAAREAAYV